MKYVTTEVRSCFECPFALFEDGKLLCDHDKTNMKELEPNWIDEVATFCPLPDTKETP